MGNFENLFMPGWNLEASRLGIIHREQIGSLTFYISRVWAICDHPLAMMTESTLTESFSLMYFSYSAMFCCEPLCI